MTNRVPLVVENGKLQPVAGGDYLVDGVGAWVGGDPNQAVAPNVATADAQLALSDGTGRNIQFDNATTGILKVASGVPSAAVVGTDYLTADSTNTLTEKGFDANGSGNSLSNVEVADFAADVVDTDSTLAANSDTRLVSQKAIKTYLDSVQAGLKWKKSVKVATTENGALATAYANGEAIDGITLVTGDRILLRKQTSPSENGVYVVNASGSPTRATDFDGADEIPSAAVFVETGTITGDTAWTCIADVPVTVDTTDLEFSQFYGVGNYTGDYGITLTGRGFAIDLTEAADLTTAQTLTNKTLTSAVLNGSISGTSILDEDDMSSDSDTQLPTQQSVKAFVDGKTRAIVLNDSFYTDGQNQLTAANVLSFVSPFTGFIVGATISADAAFSAGKTLVAEPHVNGSGVTPTDLDLDLDDSPTNTQAKSVADGTSGFAVSAGDVVGMLVSTTGVDFASKVDVTIAVKIAATE